MILIHVKQNLIKCFTATRCKSHIREVERMTIECKNCGFLLEKDVLKKNKYICPTCTAYSRIGARDRISMIADKGSFKELFTDMNVSNPLKTDGYEKKIREVQAKSGMDEAVIVGTAKVLYETVMLAVCDTSFLMGSMGRVVGEKITRAVEFATKNRLPVFIFCCSGGARMQEGIISLMQMEKTAAAIKKHDEAGLLCSTILTNPTTGGVTASFAMLGDVIMAEPGALIGFAGPRVIEQTLGQKLPIGFQSSEFQESHGMIDGIVERKRLRKMIQFLVITNRANKGYSNFNKENKNIFKGLSLLKFEHKSSLPPWERVKLQRSTSRKSALDYVQNIFDVFVELKGDRYYGNDEALIGGIAMLNGQPVTVIAENRGKDPSEMIRCNFGMPLPEGFRKALRLMKQAEKFNRPIISFINTPGAYCGIEAEERGQSTAIAQNLFEMSGLTVPILSIITGEAGSGGALATAVANQVWMLENATYSIISPEGYASILWKDASKAEEAAKNMHITAEELKKLEIVEKIIPEFKDDVNSIFKTSEYLRGEIIRFLSEMSTKSRDQIVQERYERFRKY